MQIKHTIETLVCHPLSLLCLFMFFSHFPLSHSPVLVLSPVADLSGLLRVYILKEILSSQVSAPKESVTVWEGQT